MLFNATHITCISVIVTDCYILSVKTMTKYKKEDLLVLNLSFVRVFCPWYTVNQGQLILLTLSVLL